MSAFNVIKQQGDTIEALVAVLESFPGFTNDATIGDAWIEKMRAALKNARPES